MNGPHAWWTPRLRSCVVCLALLLPGSFFVLPLVWLWFSQVCHYLLNGFPLPHHLMFTGLKPRC